MRFKSKVDSLVNGYPTQKEIQKVMKDEKMMTFFQNAGLFEEGVLSKKSHSQEKSYLKKGLKKEKSTRENMTKKEKVDKIKDEGTEFYKKKNYKSALACYQEASKIFPEEPIYFLNQAAVYLMEEDLDNCEKVCKKVIDLCRLNQADYKWPAKAYARLATVEEKRKNLDKAVKYLQDSLTEKNVEKVSQRLKQLKKRMQIQNEQRLLNPEEATNLKLKADKAFRSMKWGEAIKIYSESIKRNPEDPKVYNNRSTAYCKLMAWDSALDDASKAIILDPKWMKPYLRKAKIEQACKTYHEALMTLKLAAVNIENPNDEALKNANQQLSAAISLANQKEDPERQQRALENPHIQAIMQDPVISGLLNAAQSDPMRIQKAIMTDSNIREKVELLAAAGIIR